MNEEQIITSEDVGAVETVLEPVSPIVKPETKFSVGQEVSLGGDARGKIVEVRGTAEAGFTYAVAHGAITDFAEDALSEVK